MIKSSFRKLIYVGAAFALAGAMNPMNVQAAQLTDGSARFVGVASLFEADMTKEELVAFADASEGCYWGYTNLGIANTDGANLNVREKPSTDGKLVGKMPNHAAGEVIEVVDGWAHVISGEVEGYVSCDYFLMGADAVNVAKEYVSTMAISKENGLNVREKPSTECQVMTQIAKGIELEYVETLDDWVHVKLDDEDAYVFGQYVDIETKLGTAITMSQLFYGEGVSDIRVDIVEYAKQFLGNPYVWGGTSLTKGCDCSGFVQSVLKKFNIKVDRTSRAQAQNGTAIKESELKPGDLVFYSKNGTINHVAMYIGGGQVIQASDPKSGIKISKYNYRTPTKCVRVIKD